MENNDTLIKLISLMKKLCYKEGIDYDHIDEETRLNEDLGFTSLETLMMTIGIEKEFDIEIKGMNPATLKTVGNVVDYIKENE